MRAEERSSGIPPPEPTELENSVEEIMALEETANAEMKEDDESVKGKADRYETDRDRYETYRDRYET